MQIGLIIDYKEWFFELAPHARLECFEVYAGRDTPLDVEKLTDDDYKRIVDNFERYGLTFATVLSDVNHLTPNDAERRDNNAYFIKLIKNARKFGTEIVATNVWADPALSPEDNMPCYKEVFSEYARVAEGEGVRIAVENCPHNSQYPITIGNICYSPVMWDMMFDAVPSKAIGIEYDPSHFIFQMIDYVKAIYDYGDRIYAVHAKDAEINRERLNRHGIFGRDTGVKHTKDHWRNGWWRFRMPGMGDVDWRRVFKAFCDVGYDGPVVIEHEDPVFGGDRWGEGVLRGASYLQSLLPHTMKNKV